jgi:hypothetical protein
MGTVLLANAMLLLMGLGLRLTQSRNVTLLLLPMMESDGPTRQPQKSTWCGEN